MTPTKAEAQRIKSQWCSIASWAPGMTSSQTESAVVFVAFYEKNKERFVNRMAFGQDLEPERVVPKPQPVQYEEVDRFEERKSALWSLAHHRFVIQVGPA